MHQRVLLVGLWFLIGTRLLTPRFVPLSVSLWNDLNNPVIDGEGMYGFKCRGNASLLTKSALYCCLTFFFFHPSIGLLCGIGVSD